MSADTSADIDAGGDGAEQAPRTLVLAAPAKINLTLEILRRRADGYHDLDSVLTTIDLADEVRLTPHPALVVTLDGPFASAVQAHGELGAAAARALAAAAGRDPAVRVAITKRVPVAAGLGGGSSDAAAVLRGLNALWGLDWPVERLLPIAAALGSDVPFFLTGGTARCRGRGEIVEPLRDLRPLRLLILLPPLSPRPGKTARRFAALMPRDLAGGDHGAHAERMAQRIARGAPPPASELVNAFEAVVERSDAELLAHHAAYRAAGAPRLHLCGAGPAAFLLVTEHARLADLRRDFAAAGAAVFAAHTLPRAQALATALIDA